MNIFKPNYYEKFKCIAHRCKHSCCIGWEIDIDDETLAMYQKKDGAFGERIRESIEEGHFILGKNDRCPFLNNKNLCEIITNMGEDALCQICADHPRFRNFFSDREEIGLGMCCEEAARIILTFPDKAEIKGEDYPEDDEKVFFNGREQIFAIVQDREWSLEERIENLCGFYDLQLPDKDWQNVFYNLERLDKAWEEKLELLKDRGKDVETLWDLPFEQILVYFIYRHLSEGFYDGRIKERLLFAILSLRVIKHIFANGEKTMENLIEICRMYSSEVEYSEENIEKLLDELEDNE